MPCRALHSFGLRLRAFRVRLRLRAFRVRLRLRAFRVRLRLRAFRVRLRLRRAKLLHSFVHGLSVHSHSVAPCPCAAGVAHAWPRPSPAVHGNKGLRMRLLVHLHQAPDTAGPPGGGWPAAGLVSDERYATREVMKDTQLGKPVARTRPLPQLA